MSSFTIGKDLSFPNHCSISDGKRDGCYLCISLSAPELPTPLASATYITASAGPASKHSSVSGLFQGKNLTTGYIRERPEKRVTALVHTSLLLGHHVRSRSDCMWMKSPARAAVCGLLQLPHTEEGTKPRLTGLTSAAVQPSMSAQNSSRFVQPKNDFGHSHLSSAQIRCHAFEQKCHSPIPFPLPLLAPAPLSPYIPPLGPPGRVGQACFFSSRSQPCAAV